MTEIKSHILNLEPGDRFRFWPDGPIFVVVSGPGEHVWIRDDAGKLPRHKLESGMTFVYAIDPFEANHEPSRQ